MLTQIVEKFKKSKCTKERLLLAERYIKESGNKKNNSKIVLYPNYPKDHEIFEDIIGYEGVYKIGNWGTLRSVEGFFIKYKRFRKDKMAVYKPGKNRAVSYHKYGYPKVTLWGNGKVEYESVHRLVAKHFIPNQHNYPQVCHKDDNPKNTKWDNLYWGTQRDNIIDCCKKDRGFNGSKNGNSILVEGDIPTIRWLLFMRVSQKNISEIFGISQSQINSINLNKIWKHA